jgi:hypothetical protein
MLSNMLDNGFTCSCCESSVQATAWMKLSARFVYRPHALPTAAHASSSKRRHRAELSLSRRYFDRWCLPVLRSRQSLLRAIFRWPDEGKPGCLVLLEDWSGERRCHGVSVPSANKSAVGMCVVDD